jgi:hypothetical protein
VDKEDTGKCRCRSVEGGKFPPIFVLLKLTVVLVQLPKPACPRRSQEQPHLKGIKRVSWKQQPSASTRNSNDLMFFMLIHPIFGDDTTDSRVVVSCL